MELKFKDRELTKKVREWSAEVGITDPRGQFLCTVEECGEWDTAKAKRDRMEMMDALGDMAVVAIVQFKLSAEALGESVLVEHYMIPSKYLEVEPSVARALGLIGEGLRKDVPAQVLAGSAMLWQVVQGLCVLHGFNFEECLAYVYGHLVGRKENGRMIGGSFIKEADQKGGEEE